MTDLPDNLSLAETREKLVARLEEFRRKIRAQFFWEGLAKTLVIVAAMALVTFILDRMFRLSLAARWALLVLAGATLLVTIWREIILPLRLKLELLTLAATLDETDDSVTARVATILDLPALMESERPPSGAMVRLAVARSDEALARIQFTDRLDGRRKTKAFIAVAAAVLLPILLVLLSPGTARLWASRYFLASNEPWPQRTYLAVADLKNGVLVVPRGEPFVLRVSARPNTVVPAAVTISFREGQGSRVRANLTSFAANDFRYDFSGINDSVSAQVWGGDDVLGPFIIHPAERPRMTDLKLITQHPTEAEPKTYAFSGDDADLSFLPKTHMRLLFGAGTAISQARLSSSTTQPSAADVGRIDDRRFELDWTQEHDVQLQIELVSADAELSSMPTVVAIGLKKDQPPRVTMGYTGVHQRVTPRATIPLTVEARDDYGVARADLVMKAERPDPSSAGQLIAQTTTLPLYGPATRPSELEVDQAHRLQLSEMNLQPGSLVTVSATATDACYTGPQTSASRAVTFRVVPPEELFRELLLRQQAERAKFRKQTDEARAILEQIALPAADVAHRHRALQREVSSINTALVETITEMKLNQLATDEAYTLIEKTVLSPLKSLNNDLLNPQKEALDSLKQDDAKGVADAKDRQDRIVSQMEQILQQMSQWDSFVDVLNQLNEIIRVQDQAQQTTNQLKKQQTEGIFEK